MPKRKIVLYPKIAILGFFFGLASFCKAFFIGEKAKMNEIMKNQRVVTFLNREEVDFLDKLGKDALFSTGLKLSRTKLIAWLIDFLKGLGIDGMNITSEKDLESRVIEVLQQISQEGSVPTRHGRINGQAAETEVPAAKHGRVK